MTLQVVILQTFLGQEVRNVFHFAGGDAVQANAQAIGDGIRDAWATHLAPNQSSAWQAYAFTVKDVTNPGNPVIEYAFTAGPLNGGNASAEAVPPQVAMLISYKSLTARPNRGRSYIAGFTEANLNSGSFAPTAAALGTAFGEALIALGTTLNLAIAFTITRIEPVTGVLVGSNIVEQAVGRQTVAIQRRRRVGSGI